TNTRSPCTAARTQPSAASAESMTSSCIRGPICRILFIWHPFWRRPDPTALNDGPGACHNAVFRARRDQLQPRREAGRPGFPRRIPPLPQRAVGETTLNKKMRAFDDEVALTAAPFYLIYMLPRSLPAGFIAPCLPTKTDKLPSGSDWLHEIKHEPARSARR